MTTSDVTATVRTYLEDELGLDMDQRDNNTAIFGDELDSIEVIKLIMFLEQTYGIRIDATVTTLENFASVNAISKTVAVSQS